MRTSATWILTAAAFLMLSAQSGAEGGSPIEADPDAAHSEADTNDDSVVDHVEFHHRMVEVFYFGDIDRDGYLEDGEFERTGRGNPRAGDENSDGKVSMKEFLDEAFDRFEAFDTDENDQLSVEEVRAAYGS